jgi:hypothetical protein
MKKSKTLLISLISIFPLLSSFTSFSQPKINTSGVLDDLTSANVDLNNLYNKMSLISFQEYGYSNFESKDDNFGLYAYIYNPDIIDIDINSKLNKISINNGKYNLTYLDSALDKKYLKFRVYDYSISNAKTFNRSYCVSGFELVNNSIVTEYQVGGKYVFTGEYTTNNLNCDVTDLETISSDVNSAFYRKKNSDYHFDQVESVYFKIPNDFLNRYGNLYGVDFEYYRYRTGNIYVMNNADYALFSPYVGKSSLTNNPGYKICSSTFLNVPSWYHYDYDASDSTQTNLSYLFNGGDDFGNYVVTGKTLIDYMKSFSDTFGGSTHFCNYSEKLFRTKENLINDGYTATQYNSIYGYKNISVDINSKVVFNSTTFDSNVVCNYFSNIFKSNNLTYDYNSLVQLNSDVNDSTKYTSDNYLLDSTYLNDVKTFYTNNSADNGVYLLRVGHSDYYNQTVCDIKAGDSLAEGDDGYVAVEDVYLNFDIINFTLGKDGSYIKIPVVMSPTNVVADIVNYQDVTSGWLSSLLSILKIILLIILSLLCVFLIFKIVKFFVHLFKK